MEQNYIKMDFSLESSQERTEHVKKIIANTPPERLNSTYLEKLADYIILAANKEDRKQNKQGEKSSLLTDNRMKTVNDRETSFEGLIGKLENGEDGIYNMIANDKNIIYRPKYEITEQDIAEVPGLRELRESIERIEKQASTATGKRAYLLKKQLIEMRKDQYVLKEVYRRPMYSTNLVKSISRVNLQEKIQIDPDTGEIYSDGLITLINPFHVSLLLCNYSKIKEETYENFGSDLRWMMVDLDDLVERTFKEKFPLYYKLVIYKIDGKQNAEIQDLLYEEFEIKHSVEYISSLWRNKIPKMLSEQAKMDWLIWHYTEEEKGYWKRCSRCGQIKLGHSYFLQRIRQVEMDGILFVNLVETKSKKEGEYKWRYRKNVHV